MIYIDKEVSPNELASMLFPNAEQEMEVQFNPNIESIPNNYSCEIQCLSLSPHTGLHPESRYVYNLLESKMEWAKSTLAGELEFRLVAKYQTHLLSEQNTGDE